MSRLADGGARCVLICATGGEAGDILNPAMDRPGVLERLGEIRIRELQAATEIIGYDRVVRLGYRDSGMAGSVDNARPEAFVNAAIDEVLGRVVAIVRAERPGIVFGYDSHERYPHPDHLKVHELTLALAAAASDPTRYVEPGTAWKIPLIVAPTFTARRAGALLESMQRHGIESPMSERLSVTVKNHDDGARLVRVHVAGFVGRARSALLAHQTQVDPAGHWFRLSSDAVEEAYPYEDYELMSSSDGGLAAAGIFEAWSAGAD